MQTIIVISTNKQRQTHIHTVYGDQYKIIRYTAVLSALAGILSTQFATTPIVLIDLEYNDLPGMAWIVPCILTQFMVDGRILPVHRMVVGEPTLAERELWELNCSAVCNWNGLDPILRNLGTHTNTLPAVDVIADPYTRQKMLQQSSYARTLAIQIYEVLQRPVPQVGEWYPQDISGILDLVRKRRPTDQDRLILDTLEETDLLAYFRQALPNLPQKEQDVIHDLMAGHPLKTLELKHGLDRTTIWRIRQTTSEQLAHYLNNNGVHKPVTLF